MKRILLTAAMILSLGVTALPQTTVSPEAGSFEITPAAPPVPALKYKLLFNGSNDSVPGNAALLYLDSILLMGTGSADKSDKAMAAYDAKDMARFNTLADSLQDNAMFEELELAGRREECDWQTPIREMGVNTLLPHLSPLRHIGKIVEVRALRQIEQGRIDDALATIRTGFELANKIGKERVLISGLISLVLTVEMNNSIAQIMNRADAPNLYWALIELPGRKAIIENDLNGELLWLATSSAMIQKLHGTELSADEWESIWEYIKGALHPGTAREAVPAGQVPNVVRQASPELMRQAREEYAQTHHLTPDEVDHIDPVIVICRFYFHQHVIALDEMFKLRGLPYPILLAKSREYDESINKLVHDYPMNFFLEALSRIHKGVWHAAEVDRQIAALTTIEAIRAYAAANNGQLPARLEDIKDTPAPDNPVTGLPFDYSMDNGVVTISDSQTEQPLSYTIRIRK